MSKIAAPPDVIRWASRSGDHGDCVVAALAMATGATYEQSLQACATVKPDVLENGMNWPETRRAAKLLGFRTKTKAAGKFDLTEATGILHVYQPGGVKGFGPRGRATSHAVYLWEGRVVEPKADRQQLWVDPEQFLHHYGYKAGSLIVVEGKGED